MSLVIGGSTLALLAGCSGKPENSPVVRKKFAEVEENTKTVQQLSSDVAILNEQVRRLVEENSELRAFLPDVDGQSAVSKLSTMEGRIKQLESMAADGVLTKMTTSSDMASAPAASAPSVTTGQVAKAMDLESAPLASDKPVVALQQQVTKQEAPKPVANSFKEKTAAKPAPAPAPVKTEKAKTETKAAASTASSSTRSRGSYHVIESNETVAQIATKYGMTADEILKANRIPAGARLAKGQRLFIPAK
jgi:LysM repeat protein